MDTQKLLNVTLLADLRVRLGVRAVLLPGYRAAEAGVQAPHLFSRLLALVCVLWSTRYVFWTLAVQNMDFHSGGFPR